MFLTLGKRKINMSLKKAALNGLAVFSLTLLASKQVEVGLWKTCM
jgi:hypothetical protein